MIKSRILGSGGVIPIPRVGCSCPVCMEARGKGVPYSRTGTSYFLDDIDVLFDTPEEIRFQLEREKIFNVNTVFFTHWHPDHTLGLRILEQYNFDFVNQCSMRDAVDVYISEEQHWLFKKYSCGGFLDYYQKKGIIKIVYFSSHENLCFGEITITPFLIEHTKGFYFLITSQDKRIVYAPCEYHKLEVDPQVRKVDIFLVHNLFWEDKTISMRAKPCLDEDSFEKMLVHAKEMEAKRIVLTHIEETFKLGHDSLNKVLRERYSNFNIEAGFDGMRLCL